jgi:hypothetical protein
LLLSFTKKKLMENGAHPASNGDGESTPEGQIEMTAVDLSSPLPPSRPQTAESLIVQSPTIKTSGSKDRQQKREKDEHDDDDLFERAERDTKLELFQIDALVDVRGLKRYINTLCDKLKMSKIVIRITGD